MVASKGLSVKTRILITAGVTFLVWAHLLWDHFHGGVPTHHLLQRADMPGISNWWGGLTLPLVTFLLLFWIHKNLLNIQGGEPKKSGNNIIMRFIRALIFGILLSVFFSLGSPAPGYMLLISIFLSFFIPLYLPEYLLGLILGMSYTFGANLAILVAFVLMLVFLVAYKMIRSAVLLVIARFR